VRIQLWTYNYDPEPTGIAPLSRVWALAMRDRGHSVEIVAAHPHYPEPLWGRRLRPYREERDGLRVTRLPLWAGRATLTARLRQELSFTGALSAAAPFLGKPDVFVVVSPSFPALGPAMINARVRGVPWVLWLQDILPDGAAVSGLLEEERLAVRAARRFEGAAYRSAARVVVISDTFRQNLLHKAVPDEKILRIFNPASRPVRAHPRDVADVDDRLVVNMGNIGHSQNLEAVVRAIQASPQLAADDVRFVMAGDGVAAADVRAQIDSPRIRITGLLGPDELGDLLRRAAVGIVSQRPRDNDFNVPSKLMNFMGAGIPVVASVDHRSEVARILRESGGGWLTSSATVETELASVLEAALADPAERERRGALALRFARDNFDPRHVAERFEAVLSNAVDGAAGPASPSARTAR
jgi:colanic acid biosynthesis glycosyl transferase WcaI